MRETKCRNILFPPTRSWLTVMPFLLLSLFLTARASYFPTTNPTWQTISASAAGADAALLADAVAYAEAANSSSLVILHGGRILSENYWDGRNRNTKSNLFSASKSMVATMVGRLLAEGTFTSLDQKSSVFLDEWKGVSGKQDITLRHHLSMTTGLEGGEQNLIGQVLARNERFFAANLPLEHSPGTYWTYNNPAYRLLFSIIEEATGQSLATVSTQKLFQPLGMDAEWNIRTPTFGNQTFLNYQSINATALSAARFGLLALRSGLWNGTQIAPAAFIAESTNTSQDINPSYGFLWWHNRGASAGGQQLPFDGVLREGPYFPDAPPDLFAAIGKDDQIIAVIPSLDLVIVRQGSALGASSEAIGQEQNILFGKIAKAFAYPGQPQPFPPALAWANGSGVLTWTAWYGRKYLPQFSPDLAPVPWLPRAAVPIIGEGLPVIFPVSESSSSGFFRLAYGH
jgi:CubicO group peptidase (beta-lactamase class C family)